jgi:hypothetical protein
MLTALNIRDVVLIEALDLEFELGIGMRTNSALLRPDGFADWHQVAEERLGLPPKVPQSSE